MAAAAVGHEERELIAGPGRRAGGPGLDEGSRWRTNSANCTNSAPPSPARPDVLVLAVAVAVAAPTTSPRW